MLFVLHEKNIPCTLYEVDVSNGEQNTDWFVEMNPKMDVPVLQNDMLIVPSSSQIISYLESNFGNSHSLLPFDDRSLLKQTLFLHRKISQIPIGLISLGSILHPNIVSSPRLPFVGPLRIQFLRMFCWLSRYQNNRIVCITFFFPITFRFRNRNAR